MEQLLLQVVLDGLRLAQPVVVGAASRDRRRLHHVDLTLEHVYLRLLQLLLLLLMQLVGTQILQQGEIVV